MKSVALTVYPRTQLQRNRVKKLRAAQRIPAIIYGRQIQPQPLEITQLDFEHLVHHSATENILVDLNVTGDARTKRLALIQQVQHHPLSGAVLHVDFHEVLENEKVVVTVPVESVGEAAGVKTSGGILEHILFKIKVRAFPKDLPEVLQIDVSHLEVGQSVHIGEIKPPAGVEILGDKHIPVISVAAPMTEAEEVAQEEAATEGLAEPEVIREKKEEGEEGAEAAPKGAAEKGKPAEKGKLAEKGKPAEKAEKAEKAPEKKK